MATTEEFNTALAAVQSKANDLAKWLNTLSIELHRLEDPRAARAASMAVGCGKAANGMGDSFASLAEIVHELAPANNSFNSGTFTRSFPVAGNSYTVTITDASVSTSSFIYGWFDENPATLVASHPGTTYLFTVTPRNIVASTSFDLVLYDWGAPFSASYAFDWVRFS